MEMRVTSTIFSRDHRRPDGSRTRLDPIAGVERAPDGVVQRLTMRSSGPQVGWVGRGLSLPDKTPDGEPADGEADDDRPGGPGGPGRTASQKGGSPAWLQRSWS